MPKRKSPTRRRPRQARAQATVEAIVQAAALLLEERGYDGTTTNAVAARAGVSIGSLYQYFPNKEALVAELVQRLMQDMGAVILAALPRLNELPLRQATPAFVHAVLEAHKVNPQLHCVLHDQLPRLHGMSTLDQFEQGMELLVAGLIRRDGDQVRSRDPALSAAVLVRALAGAIRTTLRREPERIGDPAFEAELLELVERYLAP